MYNIMTCEGWEGGMSFLGACSMAWIVLVIILGAAAILRRQCDDGFLTGTGYNFIGALVGGLGGAIIIITIFGSVKIALVVGLIGLAVGGFLGGQIFDSGGY
jgi:hypothetical protein